MSDATETRPAWGTAADLVNILDVQQDSPADNPGHFVSAIKADRPGHVEGSQQLAQSIVAASRLAPGRRAVSAHMVFHRVADPRIPLEFELSELTNGRTMSAYQALVVQQGKSRAAGTILLDVTAPDLIRHQAPAPECVGPDAAEELDWAVVDREIRVVDSAYNNDPEAPVGPPVMDVWVRFRNISDDPVLHTGLLVQFTGHMSIAASMRPHAGIGQAQSHRTITTGINAIAVSLHAQPKMDQWVRYHHTSTFAGDGMTKSECRVYDEQGAVLASFSVDAMVRGMSSEPGAGRL